MPTSSSAAAPRLATPTCRWAAPFDGAAHLVARAMVARRRDDRPVEARPVAPRARRTRSSDVPEPTPIDTPPVPPERDLPEPAPIDTPPVPPTPDVPVGPAGGAAAVRRASR